MSTERSLINYFYAHNVGHAVEALHYANGHYAAMPERPLAVALNSATAVEMADFCPFVSATYPIDHPFVDACPDSTAKLAHLPRDWDWILDDPRRYQEIQLTMFTGMRNYYAASDSHLRANTRRSIVGNPAAGYLPHQPLRFTLPDEEMASARTALGDETTGQIHIVVMPAGSSDQSMYPSTDSWLLVFDALTETIPDSRMVLMGRLSSDQRTTTSLDTESVARLLAHRSQPVNCFDLPITEQLAIVQTSDLFLAPHTGFGLAALAVGTPWLALSGGRWFEYYFNHVPFRSIVPDTDRYPSFSQFSPAATMVDGPDGPRTPSMSKARIREDLDRIVVAAVELTSGSVSYEQCLRDYFHDLRAAHNGAVSAIWSIDAVHADYL